MAVEHRAVRARRRCPTVCDGHDHHHTIRGESITIVEEGKPEDVYERIAEAIDAGGLIGGRLKGAATSASPASQVSFFEVHV